MKGGNISITSYLPEKAGPLVRHGVPAQPPLDAKYD